MPLKITFVTHSTTLDNESKLASGWNDVKLSDLEKQQAMELGERQKNEHYDVIFTSDLSRAIDTATIAFKGRQIPILTDKRLRECDYGDLTEPKPRDYIAWQKRFYLSQYNIRGFEIHKDSNDTYYEYLPAVSPKAYRAKAIQKPSKLMNFLARCRQCAKIR